MTDSTSEGVPYHGVRGLTVTGHGVQETTTGCGLGAGAGEGRRTGSPKSSDRRTLSTPDRGGAENPVCVGMDSPSEMGVYGGGGLRWWGRPSEEETRTKWACRGRPRHKCRTYRSCERPREPRAPGSTGMTVDRDVGSGVEFRVVEPTRT